MEGKIIQSNPRRYGKSTLVTNAFLAEAKAGNSVRYEHPDYVCLSRKAYFSLLDQFVKDVEGRLEKKKEQEELIEPRLFQHNSIPNEYGGYSSEPFYCSLCYMSEMNIQDNKTSDDNYFCRCSVWTNSCGGTWVRWHDKEKALEILRERDNQNPNNLAIDTAITALSELLEEYRK